MPKKEKLLKSKKIFLFISFLFSFMIFLQAQIPVSDDEQNINEPTETTETIEPQSDKTENKKRTFDLFACMDAGLYLNPEQSSLNSAPSPINFELSFGATIPNYTMFSFQPSLTFFMMNHLLFEERALPAEIENRTSTTLNFYLNLPFAFTLKIPKSKFHFSLGFATMIRFAFLAAGVHNDDEGFSGSAGEDITLINKWFWKNLHWLYATIEADWLYEVSSKINAGPFLSIKLPFGSLTTEKSPQGMIFSAGLKISF